MPGCLRKTRLHNGGRKRLPGSMATFSSPPNTTTAFPAVLKNALDYAYPEWNNKPAAFVGYGSVGAARAIEQLRLIAIELQMAPIRTGVHIQGADFMAVWKGGKDIAELSYLPQNATDMLDQLVWWTKALKAAREQTLVSAAA